MFVEQCASADVGQLKLQRCAAVLEVSNRRTICPQHVPLLRSVIRVSVQVPASDADRLFQETITCRPVEVGAGLGSLIPSLVGNTETGKRVASNGHVQPHSVVVPSSSTLQSIRRAVRVEARDCVFVALSAHGSRSKSRLTEVHVFSAKAMIVMLDMDAKSVDLVEGQPHSVIAVAIVMGRVPARSRCQLVAATTTVVSRRRQK